MQTNSLKKKMQTFGFCLLCIIFSFEKSFAQEKIDCSCPMYKGKILVDDSFETMGGKKILQAEIKSKKYDVYSATPGTIEVIDTSINKRIYIRVKYMDYTIIYDNLLNTECIVGQKIERGKMLGRLELGDHLFVRVSDGTKHIDPQEVLPCKVVKVNK